MKDKKRKQSNQDCELDAVVKKGQKISKNEQGLCAPSSRISAYKVSHLPSHNINLWILSHRKSLQLRTGT